MIGPFFFNDKQKHKMVECGHSLESEALDEDRRKWAQQMFEIFDSGVQKAKAENVHLGIVVNEDFDYIGSANADKVII